MGKIFGWVFAAIGLVLAVLIGLFMWRKLFAAKTASGTPVTEAKLAAPVQTVPQQQAQVIAPNTAATISDTAKSIAQTATAVESGIKTVSGLLTSIFGGGSTPASAGEANASGTIVV